MNYWIRREGQQYGPFAPERLREEIRGGRLRLDDEWRTDAMTDWLAVSELLVSGLSASGSASESEQSVSSNEETPRPREAVTSSAEALPPPNMDVGEVRTEITRESSRAPEFNTTRSRPPASNELKPPIADYEPAGREPSKPSRPPADLVSLLVIFAVGASMVFALAHLYPAKAPPQAPAFATEGVPPTGAADRLKAPGRADDKDIRPASEAPSQPQRSPEDLAQARIEATAVEAGKATRAIDNDSVKGLGVRAVPNGLIYRFQLKKIGRGETLDAECEKRKQTMLPGFCGKKADVMRDFGKKFAVLVEYVNKDGAPACSFSMHVAECK